MNYKDVIIAGYIEDYKEQHRIFYQALSSMLYDIAFLQAGFDLQDWEIHYDVITLKMLHRNVFENLISKVHRCFFDGTGNSTSILRYKNNVLGKYLKEDYRQQIRENVKALPIESSGYKSKLKELKENCGAIRNGFVGHRLLDASDNAVVNLDEIKQLVEYGCELFQALSFEPHDFYSFIEGNGFGFDDEIKTTDKLSRNFIFHSFLTSRYITRISCEFEEYCPKDIREKLDTVIQKLNTDRKKE